MAYLFVRVSERKCATAAWVSFAKCNWETIFCGHYRPIFNHCDVSLYIIGLQSYRVRCASAVTPSEKSSVDTNRKSTMSFPMSLRWAVYVASKPQRLVQKHKVSKIWTI